MSLGGKRWLRPDTSEKAEELARELSIHPVVAAVLVNRGTKDIQSARDFLNPSLEQMHSPWLMRGMEPAVKRICEALRRGENIVVYGDYDADGICATAVLVETLQMLGEQVQFYLPSRFNGGYGLHREALAGLKQGGAGLVITVDCGISAVEEVAYARELGLDMIITDHHQPLAALQGAAAVLNPLQEGCLYPYKHLAGVGVAFKLAAALREKCGKDFPAELLDLAALGTVADVVPLLGENRVITAAGLEEISRLHRPGLKALVEASDLKREKINSGTVAFVLAPSINAPGRLGEADPAVRLLLTQDEKEAVALARQLHRMNRLRRETEQQVLQEAEAALSADPQAAGERVITLAAEGWHHGIIGIVASRLVERYYRPVVLIALEDGLGRGSARSIPGFDITAALSACSGRLERFGGHDQAAGLTLPADKVDALRKDLNRYAETHMDEAALVPGLKLEGELAGKDLSFELARQLARLQPFGTGNPAPLFLTGGWELKSWRLVGAGSNHLKLNLCGESGGIAPICFSGAYLEPCLSPGREMELAVRLKDGFFRGEPVLDIELKDLRYVDSGSSGRVEVVDRRNKGGRARYLEELLGRIPHAGIFVATNQRRAALQKSIPPGANPYIWTSGGDNGGFSGDGAPADLIIYDLPLHDGLLEPFFRRCPKEGAMRIYLLYEQRDRDLNRALMEMSLPDPVALEQIYRAVAESAAAGKPADFSEAARRLAVKPAPSFWQRCRVIFAETGLLDTGGSPPGPDLERSEESWTELLESSPAYREARELGEKCSRFQEFLLQASPKKLAAYWAEQLGQIVAPAADE